MILSLFGKKAKPAHVFGVYSAIVAQSRHPVFYAKWGVSDSVNGRFDMISLHLCLLLRRLKTGDPKTRVFSQTLFDLFFQDMDESLREMGAGDMVVPKRIQQMGELFYGMLAKLTEALDNKSAADLRSTLSRNVFDGEEPASLALLEAYVIALDKELQAIQADTILSGKLEMKAPE